MAPRVDAATFHHVAVADSYAERAADAFEEMLGALRSGFTGRRAASLVGVASPTYTAGLVSPEIAKRAPTEADLADLFAEIATAAGTTRPGFTASFNQVRDESVAYARQQAAELVTGIDQQTKGLISGIITQGQQGDLTWNQMADEIRPLIGLTPGDAQAALRYRATLRRMADDKRRGADAAETVTNRFTLSPWKGGPLDGRVDKLYQDYVGRLLRQRAVTIARTETIKAASAGEMISWQATIDDGGADGYLVTREWSTTRDDRACKLCLALDGQKRTTSVSENARPRLADDGGFGGVPHPPLHPRCRCVILTTMELAPLPDRPAPKPQTWVDKAKRGQASVARAAKKAAEHGVFRDAQSLADATKMEAAVRRLGRQVDDEIRRRLIADGVDIVDASEYRKAKAAFEKAEAAAAKRWQAMIKQEQRKGPGWPRRVQDRADADPRYQLLLDKRTAAKSNLHYVSAGARQYRTAHAAKVSEVLGELRPMGQKIDLGDIYKGQTRLVKGIDFDAEMGKVAGRFPRTWVERSNAIGPVNLKYEARRAYYHPGERAVALTPGQITSFGTDSTVTHEFMHRMEYTNPDVMRAEWAFLNRRAKNDGIKPLAELTGIDAYRPDELAFGDEFSNAYMGKVYRNAPDSPYEVMSMGVEGLYWSDRPGLDADYTHFVLGVLAGL